MSYTVCGVEAHCCQVRASCPQPSPREEEREEPRGESCNHDLRVLLFN